jgi:adenine-specific DNA-methyltransferase
MIYIDPPYNTGHDFIYHDNFHGTKQQELIKEGTVDAETGERFKVNSESNGHFHSDWCSMMYPRLKLARNLLRDDGVIFISLDDSEAINVRKLCDEIFGEANFIAQITTVSNPRGRDYGGVAKMHEYVFVYRKSEELILSLVKDENCEFPFVDKKGGFELRELRNRNIKFNKENRPNLYYPFYINPSQSDENGLYEIDLVNHNGWIELYPKPSQGINVVWRWGRQKASDNLNVEIGAKKMQDGGFMIVEKYRESRKMARSVWWDKESNTERGTIEVKRIFEERKIFDYPKPVSMIERIIEMATAESPDSLILDFFSGSATTAHAVMQLNAEDGGNRKFILVQLPEVCVEGSEAAKAGYKNICEIGKERIRRAGKKIKEENATTAQNLDVGFRVFKIDSSNMDDIYFQPLEVQQQDMIRMINNVKTDRTALDLLFGCLLEWGLPIDLPITKRTDLGNDTYDVDGGRIIASFDSNVGDAAVKAIANEKPDFAIFRDLSFNNSAAKINVGEIFKAISPNTEVKVL